MGDYFDVEKLHAQMDRYKAALESASDLINRKNNIINDLTDKLAEAARAIESLHDQIDKFECKFRGREDGIYYMKRNGTITKLDFAKPEIRVDNPYACYADTSSCNDYSTITGPSL